MNNNYNRVTIHFGEITSVDPANAVARVSLAELQGLETDWLPLGQYRAGAANTVFWAPDTGERVLVALDESGSGGCILCAIHPLNAPPPGASSNLLAVVVPTLTVAGDIEITGDVEISGNFTVTGDAKITGSHRVNDKLTVVVGSTDSRGDTNNASGQ